MENRGTLLVVDDDPTGRKTLSTLLLGSDYRLRFTANGDQAIREARDGPIALVLINPKTSGLDIHAMCRRIRNHGPLCEVPILLITSSEDTEARKSGLDAGADGVIEIPCDSAELRRRIRTVLRLNRFRRHPSEVDLIQTAEAEVSRHRTQLETLSRRLLQAQEEERRTIARELHDEIGQILTVLKINLVLTLRDNRLPTDPRLIEESVKLVDRLIGQVRDLWRNLRPSLLDEFGLPEALRSLVDTTLRRAGIEVEIHVDPKIDRLDPEQEITCYRVIQESVTNIIRHARASFVRITLRQNHGHVTLIVIDDGIGFDVKDALSNTSSNSRMGLLGMRERISLVGGTVSIVSHPGCGTQIRISLVCPRHEDL